ncbi:MAG: hypothetical protein JHC88_02750 [Niveispirillum sp.]|nr:hypothetical protein [Niveispirillum sp.]
MAAKTLALSATELFRKPEIAAKAKEELLKSRGRDFTYTPLLGDRAPALDYTDRPGTGG